MNKKIPLLLGILLILLAVVITFNATYIVLSEKYKAKINGILSDYGFYSDLLQVDEIVNSNYIGEKDTESIKNGVVLGYIYGLGDKYSEYYSAEEYETFLSELDGTTVGIGVSVIYNSEDGVLEVIGVVEGAPADGKINPGDLITAANGKKVADEGYYGTLAEIRGDEGTEVTVTVSRDGQTFDVTMTRAEVIQPSAYVIGLEEDDVGMIRITGFDNNTPDNVKECVEQLKASGVKSVVFDIRNNGGGDLQSIVDTLDYLLPEGPIAHIYLGDGTEEHYTSDADYAAFDKIAVLTNENTASAAELFASAIKDYAAKGLIEAKLVGETTYGKGVLQKFYQLSSGSVVKLTSGKFNPPYSDNFDGIGVTPDIEATLSEEQQNTNFYKLKEGNDDVLAAALEYIKN